MSRSRGRERRRVVEQLARELARYVEEETPARLLRTADIDQVVAFRTAGHRLSRAPEHRTIGRLIGVRPPTDTAPGVMHLVVQQGTDQATFRVAIGEPVTVRRPHVQETERRR